MTPLESAFLSRVGASLATGIVKQAGARLSRKLRKSETEKALERCGQVAVEALVEAGFPEGTEVPRDHLEGVLGEFAENEVVHDVLARAIREGDLPGEEVAALRECFEEAHPVETLPGFDPERGIAGFVTAFIDQADEEEVFQGLIQTKELREQTRLLREIVDRLPGSDEGRKARRSDGLRTSYLNHLFTQLRKLALSGVDPELANDPKAQMDLDAVYTALLTRELRREEVSEEDHLGEGGPLGREGEPLSALEQLDRHERLVLLGEPGSGKSTFVGFVALCMAGELLGREDANLAILTSPLPDDKGHSQKELQLWRHGPILPVRVVLRDFAAAGLPKQGTKAGARHLLDFLRAELERSGLGGFADDLEAELRNDGGLLLLDGLDEVPEAEARRVQLRDVVRDFAGAFPECRILVTSRIYAYQNQDWNLGAEFQEATLAPFSRGQIRRFVVRWYDEVARRRGLTPGDARGKAALLEQAILSNDRLLSLAERPLLLTLMASLHAWRGGTLPEKRESLYAAAVDLLLAHWERQRVVQGADGMPVVIQRSLTEWLKVSQDRLRSALDQLAFRAHAEQESAEGTADISEGDLLAALARVSGTAEANPTLLVEFLRDRAGLLLPRGVGVYTFPHRTFQEYLAARHLTVDDFPAKLATLVRDEPERWRETLLMAGAKAARGTPSGVWQLARELSPSTRRMKRPSPPTPGAPCWRARSWRSPRTSRRSPRPSPGKWTGFVGTCCRSYGARPYPRSSVPSPAASWQCSATAGRKSRRSMGCTSATFPPGPSGWAATRTIVSGRFTTSTSATPIGWAATR
jgi:hypothetical protein